VKRRLRRMVGALLRVTIRLLARFFVRGSKLSDAVVACRRFAVRGRTNTIGYFNADGEPPRAVADACLSALDAIGRLGVEGRPSPAPARGTYLSIKAPALGFDPALVGEIVDRARRLEVGIHFDSHGAHQADATFAAIAASVQRWKDGAGGTGWTIGSTLPGRWTRSLDDAERAIDMGLRVRVVKGQWADPAAPSVDPRQGVLALVDRLAGRAREVAVASHDAPLARAAVLRLREAGTPVEMELLLGLPSQAALKVARELAVPVRMYVPFGVSWLPHALEHIQKNPYIAWWAVVDATVGHFVTPPALKGPTVD
jgi:proline dehydrogenase